MDRTITPNDDRGGGSTGASRSGLGDQGGVLGHFDPTLFQAYEEIRVGVTAISTGEGLGYSPS